MARAVVVGQAELVGGGGQQKLGRRLAHHLDCGPLSVPPALWGGGGLGEAIASAPCNAARRK